MKERLVDAETVRKACLAAALQAYEDAGIRGLCEEGRWECAVTAIRELDLVALLQRGPASSAERDRVPP